MNILSTNCDVGILRDLVEGQVFVYLKTVSEIAAIFILFVFFNNSRN